MLLYLVSASLRLFEANAIGFNLFLKDKYLPSVCGHDDYSSSSIFPCYRTAPKPLPDASTSMNTGLSLS